MDATQIHLAETPPVACASCYGQYPDLRHVDFGAAFDGPVLNQTDVLVSGMTNVQIDDLIICEECLRAAAALIGLAEHDQMRELLDDMRARNDELAERLEGALALIDAKEKTEAQRETLMEQIRPKRATTKRGTNG